MDAPVAEGVGDGQPARIRVRRLPEHQLPGRWAQLRPPAPKELAATLVLALPLAGWPVKVSAGPPDDPDQPVWAGVVPVREVHGIPQPDPVRRHALPALDLTDPEWP